jgi:hypothetical protein
LTFFKTFKRSIQRRYNFPNCKSQTNAHKKKVHIPGEFSAPKIENEDYPKRLPANQSKHKLDIYFKSDLHTCSIFMHDYGVFNVDLYLPSSAPSSWSSPGCFSFSPSVYNMQVSYSYHTSRLTYSNNKSVIPIQTKSLMLSH